MKVTDSIIEILLIDNDPLEDRQVESALSLIKSFEIKLVKFYNLRDGIYFLDIHCPDVILLKLKAYRDHDCEALKIIKAVKAASVPMVTIIEPQDLKVDSVTTEVEEYLIKKNVSTALLEKSILYALEKWQRKIDLTQIKQENSNLSCQLQNKQKLFDTIIDKTSTLMWLVDASDKYRFTNHAWLKFSGLNLVGALKENWQARIHPEDLPQYSKVYQSARQQLHGFQIEYRLRSFDDTYSTFLNTAECLQDAQGEFAGFLCSCVDISNRKKVENQVSRQAYINRILAETITKIHGCLEVKNVLYTAVEEVKQFLAAEKIFVAKIIPRQTLNLVYESGLDEFDSDQGSFSTRQLPTAALKQYWSHLAQGNIIALNNSALIKIISNDEQETANIICSRLIVPIIFHQQLWGLFCIEQESIPRYWQLTELEFIRRIVTQLGIAVKQSELYQELERVNHKLQYLAVVDGLTQVANRRRFDQYLEIEWKRLSREQNSLSLILCDVDHFKLYNDAYGHQAGDDCLYKIAQSISETIKRPGDMVARYGGEEFAIILPNTDLSGVKHMAQKICSQIAALKIPHIDSPVDLYVTVSCGASSCQPSQCFELEDLIAAADQNLYKAKELGRNQVIETQLEKLNILDPLNAVN